MPKLATLTKDAELKDVRTAITDAARELLELRATPADKRGSTYEADLKQVADFIVDHDLIEKALSVGERAAVAEAREEADKRNKGKGGRANGAITDDPLFEGRSMGRQVTEADDYTEWAKEGRSRSGGAYTVEVRNLIGGFTAGAYDSGSDGLLPVGSPVMVPGGMTKRRLFVRDLMSVQGTGLRVIPYVRELNAVTNETGAGMVSEGSAKTEVTMQFENYTAIVEKIAAWIPATDEILTDAPTLRGYIDTRLAYMLDIKEEQQVLSGTGTSPQLPGAANLTNKQTQSAVAGDFPATIGQAIGKVENVDGDATGVVCNPVTYWTAVTKRHADQFDNGFGGGAPGSAAMNITWGVPTVRSRVMDADKAWVADWKMGSTLFDRQQTTIKVGDQHSDFFVRNLLVILAEKRVAVAWHRENLFVLATVPTS